LPIAKHRQQIIAKLEKAKVLIVSGDTGCGKTTQVPKYILENGMHNNKEIHIICTQPRRLAAINIAKRVAQELGERVGQTVGYHVGMQRRKTPYVTRITFMTTGIFLMRLVNNPRSLQKYSHLIMDEVHERDLDIDFSLVVVKHLLAKAEADGLKFKLILMSATFNVELFSNYFAKKSVEGVETVDAYKGVEERYAMEAKQQAERMKTQWGPASHDAWSKPNQKQEAVKVENKLAVKDDDDDEWVNTDKPTFNVMPVQKAEDPCEIVEINARLFQVKEFYLDKIVENLKS
jgi:HrpA-like RNA helicase